MVAQSGTRARPGISDRIRIVAGLFFVAAGAHAQTIDEVVVTGRRRSETVASTPASVTAVDADVLGATGSRSFADLAKLVPGLSFTDLGPGNKRYALRGLQSAGEPEVSLYYDEVPISGIPGSSLDTGDSQLDVKLWDVDRVEVLQGPQGTFYGNGSIGGTIRILSNRPDLHVASSTAEASVSTTQGGDPSVRLRATLNLPLVTDRLAVRVAAWRDREGGWIDSEPSPAILLPQIDGQNLNWEHTDGVRASLGASITPGWTLTAIGTYQQTRTGSSFEVYPDYASSDDRFMSQAYVRRPWRDRARLLNLISDTDLGWAQATLNASYQRRTVARTIDTTRYLLGQFGCTEATWNNGCSGRPIVPAASFTDESVHAWSGEARLRSRTAGRLQWIVGAFVQTSGTGRRGQVAKVNASGRVVLDRDHVAEQRLFARNNRDGFDQQALFAEVEYHILSTLSATGGLRIAHTRRSDRQTIVQQFFPGQPVGDEARQRFGQTKILRKFELSFKPSAAATFYAEAAQGFRSGGPNYPGGFSLAAPPYGADSVWDYEAGWKLRLSPKLYWDGAAFDVEWRKLQQLLPQPLFSYIVNAGHACSRGFETSLSWSPLRRFTLSGNLAYADARLVGPQPGSSDPAQTLRSGDRLANVPTWTGHASMEYERPLGLGSLTGRVDLRTEDGRNTTVARSSPTFRHLPGFSLVDAHLSYEAVSHWRISLDAYNVFNRFAQLSGKSLDSNRVATVTAARPRTIGVTVGWRR